MAIPANTRLGPYEVVAPLGAGGMGEVYRARDVNLGREVAIKVLPAPFALDAERVARFRREAQTLASLNHPHIAQIYGLEEHESRSVESPLATDRGSRIPNHVQFLVMELVDGETLDKRIARGPIPFDEALPIASQIAEALEAAHGKGIIHRDLKPANIALTHDGQVKVLDFGLAKMAEARAPGTPANADVLANSPTITSPALLSGMGVILGTAAYMAPEQAKGRPADNRSDVWAFGCVLYEMLTGKRAFEGDDVSDTFAAILRGEPDWGAVPRDVPPAIRAFLRRCLQRDPRQRLTEVASLVFLATEPALLSPTAAAPAIARPSRLRAVVIGVIAGAAAASISGLIIRTLRPTPTPGVVRLELMLPEAEAVTNFNLPSIAISPDGREIAYAASNRLFVRGLSELVSRPIPGTEGQNATNPVFSPDGRFLVFRSSPFSSGAGADSALKKVPVSGGTPVTLASGVHPFGMTWNEDGIVFVRELNSQQMAIVRVSPDGGTPEVLIQLQRGEDAQAPQLLPDRRTVLFTLAAPGHWERSKLVIESVGSTNRRLLVDGAADGRILPTGHLVYAVGGTLFATRFDARRRETRGGAVPIVEGVRRAIRTVAGTAQFAVSAAGALIYWPGRVTSSSTTIALMDRGGAVSPLKIPPGEYEYPRVSPDGRLVAFQTESRDEAIVWVYDLSGTSAVRRLTFGGRNRFPLWSADGRRIAFQSDRDGDLGLFWTAADGSGPPERLTKAVSGAAHAPESWSPDGSTLLFSVVEGPRVSLRMLSLKEKKATAFDGVESTTHINAVFSPDGRWVAYTSTEPEGAERIYIQPMPPTGAKYEIPPVTGDNPHDPLWSRDGTQLFYVPHVGGFMVVGISTRPTIAFGNPVPVPRSFDIAPNTTPRTFDMTPDGKILGIVTPEQLAPGSADAPTVAGTAASRRIEVVLDWFDDLNTRVP